MQAKQFHLWLNIFAEQARLFNERRLVVLSGSEHWALTLVNPRIHSPQESFTHVNKNCLIYGDSELFPINISAKRFRDKLGSESDTIIFVDSQFRIDALAALSGTLKAGGILFIVMPELDVSKRESQFVSRFFKLLDDMLAHAIIFENNPKPQTKITIEAIVSANTQQHDKESFADHCATSEQLIAVEAIEKVVTGHRKRPLVLTADRGRGKSSALAIACAKLLSKARADIKLHIIITAPDSQSLSVFFNQLVVSLPDVSHQENIFTHVNGCVEFIPVDQLIKHQPKASLLLVDEAAAIPIYLLEQLLSLYHRVVFSSTVHGYEGAGRGFTLKFQQNLTKACPNWRALHINEPIRWRLGDPLEQFIFETCLLNSELENITGKGIESKKVEQEGSLVVQTLTDLSNISSAVFSASDLISDESLLRQVFSILVTAHYQTKPSDVKLLLDNPNVQLLCLIKANNTNKSRTVLGVALLLTEGCVDDIDEVKNGLRRLKNHFLPQSLLTHCGFEQAFNYSYLRIMRIAVHPQLQNQGLGSQLLAHIEQLAIKQAVDFIGASFGVNLPLLSFWLNAGMQVTRIGFTKDKASGEHSVMVLKAINHNLGAQLIQVNDEFCRSFDFLLADEYKTLSADLVLLLLSQKNQDQLVTLAPTTLANVQAFAQGQRLYSNCAYSLYLWLKQRLLVKETVEYEPVLLAMISRLMQKHCIDELCQQYSYTGKKMLEQAFKDYVQQQLVMISKEEK